MKPENLKTHSFVILALVTLATYSTGFAQDAKPAEALDTTRKALVQPGLGTLKQDEFTLGIRVGALLVKVTPLNERVIRLAAPDT